MKKVVAVALAILVTVSIAVGLLRLTNNRDIETPPVSSNDTRSTDSKAGYVDPPTYGADPEDLVQSDESAEFERQTALFISRLRAVGEARFFGIERWADGRGWGDRPYRGYPKNSLESLAEAGDPHAAQELARALAVADPDQSLRYFELASALGFSSANVRAGQLRLGQSQRSTDFQARTQGLIDAYAWALTAQMRNDPAGFALASMVESEAGFSEKEFAKACQRSLAIYNDVLEARSNFGLDQLDSTPPDRTNRDLSSAGQKCSDWPVARAFCELEPFSEDLPLMKIYVCRIREN